MFWFDFFKMLKFWAIFKKFFLTLEVSFLTPMFVLWFL